MEPDREEPQKALQASAGPKRKRFRIVKLEERIAPSKGGNGTNNGCYSGHPATHCGLTCPAPTGTCIYPCTITPY